MRFYLTFLVFLIGLFFGPVYLGKAFGASWEAASLSSGLKVHVTTADLARKAAWRGEKINPLNVPNTAAHLDEFFDWLGVTIEGSVKRIEPVFVRRFPPDYDQIQLVEKRKEMFVKVLLPLILRENSRLLALRERLIELKGKSKMTDKERRWVSRLNAKYGLDEQSEIAHLLNRVDIVPAGLALAQAANESGWGTSRFSMKGNALFGQWTWSSADSGLDPLDREEGKKHRVKAFPSLYHSIKAYMLNLNRHHFYQSFREMRAYERRMGKEPYSFGLTQGLIKYSTKRQKYVDLIRELLTQNRFGRFDSYELKPHITLDETF